MPKNKLYHTLQTSTTFKADENLQLLTNSKQENYAHYRLPTPSISIALKQDDPQSLLTLTAQHLSFYEEKDDDSPYHHTAYFKDRKGDKYKSHVFFNPMDQIIKITWQLQNGDNVYTNRSLPDTLCDALMELARGESFKLIAPIQQQAKEKFDFYYHEYQELEKNLAALSQNMAANQQAYQAGIVAMLRLLKPLTAFDPYYQPLLRFFTQVNSILRLSTPDSLPQQANQSTIDDEKNEAPATIMIPKNKVQASQPKKAGPSLQSLIISAQDTQEKFENAENLNIALDLFMQAHQQVQDLLISVEFIEQEKSPAQITVADVNQAYVLFRKNREAGKNLLISLLSNKQFDLASQLQNFTDLLLPDYIEKALTNGDAELLNFLLTHGHFAIDTYLIGEPPVPPVLFCFLNHNDAIPQTACLSVLIKHKASLMVEVPNNKGPLAHILHQQNQPLKAALAENIAFLGTSLFYKLAAYFKNCAAHATTPEEQQQHTFIAQNYKYQTTLYQGTTKLPVLQELVTTVASHSTSTGRSQPLPVEDPEIKAERSRLQETTSLILQAMDPNTRRKTIARGLTEIKPYIMPFIEGSGAGQKINKEQALALLNLQNQLAELKYQKTAIVAAMENPALAKKARKNLLNQLNKINTKIVELKAAFKHRLISPTVAQASPPHHAQTLTSSTLSETAIYFPTQDHALYDYVSLDPSGTDPQIFNQVKKTLVTALGSPMTHQDLIGLNSLQAHRIKPYPLPALSSPEETKHDDPTVIAAAINPSHHQSKNARKKAAKKKARARLKADSARTNTTDASNLATSVETLSLLEENEPRTRSSTVTVSVTGLFGASNQSLANSSLVTPRADLPVNPNIQANPTVATPPAPAPHPS